MLEVLLSYTNVCSRGGTGRRAGLRILLFTQWGFKSPRLHQKILQKRIHFLQYFFIQASGLAYHRRTKCGVYHQGRLAALVSHHAPACIFLRLDDIQHFVLMICNSFGIDDIHALRRDFMASCIFIL